MYYVHGFRFPDTGTRVAWQEALSNAVMYQKTTNVALAATRRAWVAKAVEGDVGLKGRGILASAVDASSSDENSKSSVSPKGGFSGGASAESSTGTSHVHRLLRLRTERAAAYFLGGVAGRPAVSAPPASRPNPSDVKVILNNYRGSSSPLTNSRKGFA